MDRPPSDEATLAGDAPVDTDTDASANDLTPTVPRARTRETGDRRFGRGDELGRYVILEQIGVGGMGVVYAAWDPKLDRKVAIKLLHGDKQRHGQRLQREAQAMARLKHPNVVAVFDTDAVDDRVFVAMEFVDGQTLSEWAGLQRSRADARVDAPEREWSETLDVLLAAGRGLAAAHAQGLVHRDFKPDNVMIDADGRVRVMDFGLVREAGSHEEHDTPTDAAALEDRPHMHEQLESASAFESQLTLAGALLGTPAYMAPEQLRGDAADTRSDQFSFCVVAWQCLFGTRPFGGDTPLATLFAITHAQFREPAPGRVVPTRIRRVLERGLAADPSARWPDINDLLRALADDPRARRRPWLLAGASLAVAFAAAIAAIVLEPDTPPRACAHAGDEIESIWSDARAAELAAKFADSELVYADASWSRVASELERWSSSWIAATRDACEATEIRREQSAELLDLRMACLDQRLHRFRALVDVFAAADDTVIEKAIEAIEALPSLDICADRSWLTAAMRPPEDAQLAAEVERVRELIDRSEALTAGGKPADAIELAERAEIEALELGWQPLIAEAATCLGNVRHEQGEFEGSRTALEAGYFAARRSGHDEVTVRAAYLLIVTLSLGMAEFEAADRWARHALAEGERIGRADLLAEVWAAIGIHSYMQAKLREAEAAFKRSLELHTGKPTTELATAHINLGTVLVHIDRSRRNEAFRQLDIGLDMLLDRLGGQHPSIAVALSNYATVLGSLDEHERAIGLLERALTINELALGRSHPMTALVELNLSTNLAASKPDEAPSPEQLQRALDMAERSLATHVAVFGDRHTRVAESHKAIARALLGLERPAEALPHVDTALDIWRATFGDAHEKVDAVLILRARCLHGLGRSDEAIAMIEQLLGPRLDDVTATDVRLQLATWLLERDPTRARALLDDVEPKLAPDDERGRAKLAELRHQLVQN